MRCTLGLEGQPAARTGETLTPRTFRLKQMVLCQRRISWFVIEPCISNVLRKERALASQPNTIWEFLPSSCYCGGCF
jgi:hypothetical protein